MKRSILLTFILVTLFFSILACNLTGPGNEPTLPVDLPTYIVLTQAIEPSTTADATLSPSPTDAPTSLPSETLTETPTEMATPLPQVTLPPTFTPAPDGTRIQFQPGGTWAEVVGAGLENKISTFVLGASKGQIMSVSVFDGPGYYLTITGADGAVITPLNSDDFFWRGPLPATQDYLISVLAPYDGNFSLRVAINPPGQSEQVFNYFNASYAFALQYSDAFAPVEYPFAFLQRGDPTLALNVLDTSFYENTNLVEAYFVLNLFSAPDIVATCNQPNYEQEQAQGQATFNGVVYEKSTAGGVGAGNIYEQTIYRTVQRGACMEVVFFVHYGNIGNYTPGTVIEFDAAALMQKLEEVLGTLTLE